MATQAHPLAPTAADRVLARALYLDLLRIPTVKGNGKVPEAMAAGQMDAGYVGITRLFRAFEKGAPILAATDNHTGGSEYLVVRKDSGIEKAEDLVGKKIMLGSTPETTNVNWINYAAEHNIPVDPKKYDNYAMSDKDAYLAMKAGHLDAFDTCDPWGSMAVYEGTGKIIATFAGTTGKNDGTCCVFSMNKNFVAEHRALALKLMNAHVDALKFIYLHPKKSAEVFAKAYSVPEEVALMTIYRKTVAEGRTLNWTLDIKRVQATADYSFKVKLLEKPFKAEEFADMTLYKEAGLPDFNAFISGEVDKVFPTTLSYEDWKAKATAQETAGL